MKKGFTLIELLVVVLIIGILSAVALPQYQKAVLKARVSSIFPVLDALVKAQELYYLANGKGTSDARELDIQLPGNCTLMAEAEEDGSQWSCGKDFKVALKDGYVSAVYCPDHNTSTALCKTNQYVQIGFTTSFYSGTSARVSCKSCHRCWMPAEGSNAIGESICKTLGSPVTCGNRPCYNW